MRAKTAILKLKGQTKRICPGHEHGLSTTLELRRDKEKSVVPVAVYVSTQRLSDREGEEGHDSAVPGSSVEITGLAMDVYRFTPDVCGAPDEDSAVEHLPLETVILEQGIKDVKFTLHEGTTYAVVEGRHVEREDDPIPACGRVAGQVENMTRTGIKIMAFRKDRYTTRITYRKEAQLKPVKIGPNLNITLFRMCSNDARGFRLSYVEFVFNETRVGVTHR